MGRKRKTTQRDPARMAAELDALYAELPNLDCKGRCWKCCGPVLMAPGERERLASEGGAEVPTIDVMHREHRTMCPALKNHRCTAYLVRPLMCRLWGIEETMRCPYGCVPEGGWMTEEEATGFWLRAYAIAGWPVEKDEQLSPQQVLQRLRGHQAKMRSLSGGAPARVQPDAASGGRRRLLPWRRS
jgi:hypothetical protein